MKKTLQKFGVFTLGLALVVPMFAPVSASAEITKNMCSGLVRDLTLGSTGSDVITLQTFLEEKGYLTIPTGTSKGYFGALTKAGLAKYQSANAISPAAGYFGPITRGKLVAACVNEAEKPGNNTNAGTISNLKGGDGDFKKFSILSTPNNEDVEEGESVEVFGFEFEASKSDLKVERADFTFSSDANQKKPWRVFEEIKLIYDGDEVASFDASDEDNWEEENNKEYSLTFSNISTIIEQGDKAKFYVEVTSKDSVKDSDFGDWRIKISDSNGIRAINAKGINVYDGKTSTRTFTLKEFEAGDLSISVDEDENKDRTIEVDDDKDTDDEVVYIAKVESKDGDNTLEDITVTMTSPSGELLINLIDTVYLFVDGDEVGSESIPSGATTTSIVFDDIDFDLAEDEEVDVEVRVDLNDTNDQARYQDGDTFRVTGISVDYVDSNDDDQTEADQTDGGLMTVNTAGFEVTSPSVTATESFVADDSGESDVGTYVIKFKVVAGDEDVYVGGADFSYTDDSKASAAVSFSGPKTKLQSSGNYKVSKGKSEIFTLTVELTATSTVNTAQKVWLEGVQWNTTNSTTTYSTYESNLDDFETDEIFLRKI